MLSGGEPAPCRLDADEPDILSSDKRVERPYCVRACARRRRWRRGRRRVARGSGLYLRPYNGLEVAHDPWVRRGSYDAPDDVVGVLDVRHPVSYGFVDGVFEGARTAETGTTSAPRSFIRTTFSLWRRVSSSPM